MVIPLHTLIQVLAGGPQVSSNLVHAEAAQDEEDHSRQPPLS